jgi:AcrR family transcriptional regulator
LRAFRRRQLEVTMPSATRSARPAAAGPDRTGAGSGRPGQVRAAALDLFAAQGYRATTVDQIGERVGIKGPSVYKHVRSKQDLLVDIVVGAVDGSLAAQRAAIRSAPGVREQLRLAVEAHVRFHAEHPREASVAGRELDSLPEPQRSSVLRKRAEHDRRLRRLVETGVGDGVFDVAEPRLAAAAILDMGRGVAGWFRPGGPVGADQLASRYADLALRMLGARRSTRERASVR